MAVTYEPISQIDMLAFRLSWSSDLPAPVTFRIYREGLFVGEAVSPTGSWSMDFQVGPGEAPFVEVLDDDEIPSLAFPGAFTLHWIAASHASVYRIEEEVDSVWTPRDEIPEIGDPAYTWRSRWLEDGQTHNFRVIAVDGSGNEASALGFIATMVRHPDPPLVAYTYNGAATPTLTISPQ